MQNVPERKSCEVGVQEGNWRTETRGDAVELTMDTDVCKGSDNEVNFVEHVQAFLSKTFYFYEINLHVQSNFSKYLESISPSADDDIIILTFKTRFSNLNHNKFWFGKDLHES